MAEKKKMAKKAIKKDQKPVRVMVQEDVMPAIDIANIYNISSFDFYLIKDVNGISDSTPLTMSEFKRLYNKAIRR